MIRWGMRTYEVRRAPNPQVTTDEADSTGHQLCTPIEVNNTTSRNVFNLERLPPLDLVDQLTSIWRTRCLENRHENYSCLHTILLLADLMCSLSLYEEAFELNLCILHHIQQQVKNRAGVFVREIEQVSAFWKLATVSCLLCSRSVSDKYLSTEMEGRVWDLVRDMTTVQDFENFCQDLIRANLIEAVPWPFNFLPDDAMREHRLQHVRFDQLPILLPFSFSISAIAHSHQFTPDEEEHYLQSDPLALIDFALDALEAEYGTIDAGPDPHLAFICVLWRKWHLVKPPDRPCLFPRANTSALSIKIFIGLSVILRLRLSYFDGEPSSAMKTELHAMSHGILTGADEFPQQMQRFICSTTLKSRLCLGRETRTQILSFLCISPLNRMAHPWHCPIPGPMRLPIQGHPVYTSPLFAGPTQETPAITSALSAAPAFSGTLSNHSSSIFLSESRLSNLSSFMSLASRIGKRTSISSRSIASRASVASSWSFHKATGFPRGSSTSHDDSRPLDADNDDMRVDLLGLLRTSTAAPNSEQPMRTCGH